MIDESWFDFHLGLDNFGLILYLFRMYLNIIILYKLRPKN